MPAPWMIRWISWPLLALCVTATCQTGTASEPAVARLTFEEHVRPILKAYCLDCHGGGEKPEGGLDLRLRRWHVSGGESGPALIPGQAAQSLLLQRIKSGEMPPGEKKVPAAQAAILEAWIAAGAPTSRDEPESLPPGLGITAEERAYWAFQPLRRPVTPTTQQAIRTRNAIDAFLQSRLEAVGLALNRDAERFTLLKRATFDLTGLPPTEIETAEFLAEQSPDAYERLLDRLLASPHYGERWARHWLDVAGYSDSEGDGSADTLRPFIYKFRDYVIRSLNADKPLSDFLIEQLAGDELVPPPRQNLGSDQLDQLIATGYLRMAADPTASGQGEPDASRNQVVSDTVKIVSSGLLGLSVGCAQCHDHRYDPISQTDYYQFRAIFEPALNWKAWVIPRDRVISLYTDADRALAAAVDAEVTALQKDYQAKRDKFVAEAFDKELEKRPEPERASLRAAFQTPDDKRTDDQKKLVASNPNLNINPGVLYQYNAAAAEELKKDDAAIQARRAQKPVEDFISVLVEPAGTPPPTVVFHRGDYRQSKQAVPPADLEIAAADGQRFLAPDDDPNLPTSGRRLAWARHLVRGDHPLAGRVLANRIWLHHFGRGIVETPGEFGQLGARPTHPELLDWLATELARGPWSVKRFHRTIMETTAYRQTSLRQDPDQARDADGSLYSRYPVRRLEAEIVRDRVLAAAGRLNDVLYGKPVETIEDFAGQVHVKDDVPRRSIYIQDRRSKPVSLLAAFDAPQMSVNCERRISSTVAPQSLMLMNGDFLLAQANHLAGLVRGSNLVTTTPEPSPALAQRFGSHSHQWQFGYGYSQDLPSGAVSVLFAPLPHYTGSSWQGGPTLPDPTIGWSLVHAAGGHPGDQQHSVIRRWTAPRDGLLTLSGTLKHGSENGDGVRSRLVVRGRIAGQWTAKAGMADTAAAGIPVSAGDKVDLITDCLESHNSDSFEWPVTLELVERNGMRDKWDLPADFHGPLGASLPQQITAAWKAVYGRAATAAELELACQFVDDQGRAFRASGQKTDPDLMALAALCQQLLSSNEFLYVD